jgi:Periplasmic copper-binding protein (NosD)
MHGSGLLRRGALLGALASLAAVGLAVQATAATPVTSLTSCQGITSPGTYRLDANVAGAGGFCFPITANNVTLILNDHTITGSNSTDDGIFGLGSGAQIVGPGTVTGFDNAGIELGGGGSDSVRGVTATKNSSGIILESAGNSVRGNVTTDNGTGTGAGLGASGNTIIGNYAHGNTLDGLKDNNPTCDSNVWRGNDLGTADPSSCIH